MNRIQFRKAAFPGWLGSAVLALSLASSASLYAQHDKDKEKEQHSRPSQPNRSARPNPGGGGGGASPRSGGYTTRPNNQAPRSEAPHAEAPRTETPHAAPQRTETPHAEAPRANPGESRTPAGNPPNNGGFNRGGNGQPNPAGRGNGQPNPASRGNDRPGGGSTITTPNRPAGNGNPQQNGGGYNRSPNNGNSRPGGNNAAPNNTSGRQFGGGGRPGGAPQVVRTRNGGEIHRASDGAIREVRTPGGAVIHHAPGGIRRVEVSRPGGRVVVASAGGRVGYVQRPLVVGSHNYIQRTYVSHNVSYTRVYRPYLYHGITFHVYTPSRYYSPGFYSYAYSPWARPVYYSWGWGGSPWYGYYGGWFTPYPYYATPALWLTDFLISETLQDAYQARMDAAAANAQAAQANNYASTPLTPDVKQAIADEVHRQLEQEKADEAQQSQYSDGPPPLFRSNGPQIFVVSTGLDVNSGGQSCAVTEGDVLQMNGPPPPDSTYANVTVLASKGRDCRKGSVVSVSLDDLQEMQNQMRATIDRGLGDLQSKQGQGGLPTLPPSAAGAPVNAPFAGQVQADSNAASELSQAAQEASRDEQDVVNQGQDTPPVNITLGMSVDDVVRSMGNPRNIADLGSKKIYVYNDLKVTFVNGKVSDVQ